MNSSDVGIKIGEGWGHYKQNGKNILIWLFWKDKEYPFNHIGGSVERIAKTLGITKEESEKLLVEKLEEILPTIEDEKTKVAIEKRIRQYRHDPPEWKKPLKCIGCGSEFIPHTRRQHYCCRRCREETKLRREAFRIKRGKTKNNSSKKFGNPKCPYCGGDTFKKGLKYRADETVQRFKCYNCGRTFQESYLTKRGPEAIKND